MTTEAPEAEIPPERMFHGRVTIEWPGPQQDARYVEGWKVTAFDAETGECVSVTAMEIRLIITPSDCVVAEMTHILGPDGLPARPPVPGGDVEVVPLLDGSGKLKTGVFRYLVTGMRVR